MQHQDEYKSINMAAEKNNCFITNKYYQHVPKTDDLHHKLRLSIVISV